MKYQDPGSYQYIVEQIQASQPNVNCLSRFHRTDSAKIKEKILKLKFYTVNPFIRYAEMNKKKTPFEEV
jgi:hypothetical protein